MYLYVPTITTLSLPLIIITNNHTHTHTHIHTHTQTNMHARAQTLTHTHTYIYMYLVCIRTHTCFHTYYLFALDICPTNERKAFFLNTHLYIFSLKKKKHKLEKKMQVHQLSNAEAVAHELPLKVSAFLLSVLLPTQ